jgi:protein involved in polysaccharide export with SLBB domain
MMRIFTIAIVVLTMLAPSAGRSQVTSAPAYQLGVADKVRITVYGEPTLSGEFLVNADGSLALPLIGNMAAAGLAAPDLQAILEAKYAEGYLRSPRVGVEVLTYRPFYIYGQVVKPGEYPYSKGLSIMKAVSLAEGFTARANKGKIFIKPAAGKERRAKVDELIQPGDLIRIPGRNF